MSNDPTVDVGEHLGSIAEVQVSGGCRESASDVVQVALRVLEEQEVEIAHLRAALIQGEASGLSDRNVIEIWATVKEQSGAMGG